MSFENDDVGRQRKGEGIMSDSRAQSLSMEFESPDKARHWIDPIDGSGARDLRDAMGCYATGVTVVTTRTIDGRPVGFTANSFTSVSLDPPLLLVCPSREAGSLPAFEENDHFAVNVLHSGQQECSTRFATKATDKFGGIDWTMWDREVPIIAGSLASFECSKVSMTGAGDHMLLLGRVMRARYEPELDPLIFFQGKYRRIFGA